MALTTTNLNMVRGRTFSFDIHVTNTSDGSDENLTNGTLTFTAKYDVTDANASAVFTKTIGSGITLISAPDGTANVTILPADTAALPYVTMNLVYDLRYVSSASEEWSVLAGNLQVVANVTR